MSAPFVLAVPSKGRLQENAEAFFSRAGLALAKPRGARDYRGTISGLDTVEIAYLSASEIASQLARGTVHLGVTGEDLVRESIADADRRVLLIDNLGFGSANVVVAVPSKGRLQENAEAFFTRAGLTLAKSGGARDYRGTIAELDNVEIAYLSASEIAAQLARGMVHLGVTGEDLLRESIADADKRILLIDSLGFGSANVVVAVPQAWIDVRTMADLDDVTTGFRAKHNRRMRVATKYINLTRTFFASHGVVDYRIVESAGATEGAPAVGTAEMIVDITTTGATLAANGLKVLDDGVILRSQANLVASRDADWSSEARETARVILDHIAARARASKYKEVRTRFAGCNDALLAEAHNRFGVVAPFGGPTSSGMLTLHCPPMHLYALGSFLREHGADTVSVGSLDYVLDRENPLFARLEAFLRQ